MGNRQSKRTRQLQLDSNNNEIERSSTTAVNVDCGGVTDLSGQDRDQFIASEYFDLSDIQGIPRSPWVRIDLTQSTREELGSVQSEYSIPVCNSDIPTSGSDNEVGSDGAANIECDDDDVFLSATSNTGSSQYTMLGGMYYLHKPTLFKITSEGGEFQSESHHLAELGVALHVPEGAVPVDTTLNLEVAVCLNIDQSDYPDDTAPISPVLMVHSKESVNLQKPITITLPHILSDDIEASDVGVMKAAVSNMDGSNQYQFEKIPDCQVKLDREHNQGRATFSLDHLCYIQLYTSVTPEKDSKIKYCICPVLPKREKMLGDESFKLYFCLTYDIFIEAIQKQCEDIPRLKGYEIDLDKIQRFSLKATTSAAAESRIKATCNSPSPGSGWDWRVLINGAIGISTSSIDPWNSSEHKDIEFAARNFIYPPNFNLQVSRSGDTTKHDTVVIDIIGGFEPNVDTLKVDIHLPGYQSTISSEYPSSSTMSDVGTNSQSSSPQHQVMRKNFNTIVGLIKLNLLPIADKFYAEELISDSVHDETRNERLPESERARNVAKYIMHSTQIGLPPDKLDMFLTILASESDANREKVEEIRRELREAQSPTSQEPRRSDDSDTPPSLTLHTETGTHTEVTTQQDPDESGEQVEPSDESSKEDDNTSSTEIEPHRDTNQHRRCLLQ